MGGVLRAVMEQAGRRGSEQGRIVTAVLPYSPVPHIGHPHTFALYCDRMAENRSYS